jgi:DnaJ-class molecular chaperone
MPETDYYAILGVSHQAAHNEIKRAYRRLARKYHPDLNQQTLDAHIKRLNEAYDILGDPAKRAAYDQQRHQEEQRRKAARETLRQQQEQELAQREPKMTWIQGIFGFVRELRRELREP